MTLVSECGVLGIESTLNNIWKKIDNRPSQSVGITKSVAYEAKNPEIDPCLVLVYVKISMPVPLRAKNHLATTFMIQSCLIIRN